LGNDRHAKRIGKPDVALHDMDRLSAAEIEKLPLRNTKIIKEIRID